MASERTLRERIMVTDLAGRLTRYRLSRWLAVCLVAYGAAFYWVGATIKPGYSQMSQFISELNARDTPYAVLLGMGGFLPLGLLFAAFLLVATPLVRVGGPARVGWWLLWSQPIAFVGVALLPCDLGCPIKGSVVQGLHDLLGLATYFPCALGLLLLSWAPPLRTAARLYLRLAGVGWLFLFVAMLEPGLAPVRGLLQRLADLLLAVSVLLVAWRMVGQGKGDVLVERREARRG